MLNDALLAAAAVVGLLESVNELDCAAAELEEDSALAEDEDGVAAEALALDVWSGGDWVADCAVVAGVAVVVCCSAELVNLSLFGHKLDIMSSLKILPSSVELPTTTPPQLSRTPLAT